MVTDEEVVEAQARHVQALADLNPGVVPATLDQLQALLTPIRTSLVNLNDNVESLKHKVESLDHKVDAINENSKTFQRNSQRPGREQSMRMSRGNDELWRPTKTSAGFAAAPPLPEMAQPWGPPAAVQQVFYAPAPPPGLRTLPPAALSFPATAGQTISRAELGYLARWYNDEFGIVAADNHDEQMKKFRDFLCGM
eukprot:3934699-Rhodomonas_salina.1